VNPVIAGLIQSRKVWLTFGAATITLCATLSHEVTWSQATAFFTVTLTGLVVAIGLEDMGKGAAKINGQTQVALASLSPPAPLPPVPSLVVPPPPLVPRIASPSPLAPPPPEPQTRPTPLPAVRQGRPPE
jgi:hypothetical protein